jgi:cell division protein FtsL
MFRRNKKNDIYRKISDKPKKDISVFCIIVLLVLIIIYGETYALSIYMRNVVSSLDYKISELKDKNDNLYAKDLSKTDLEKIYKRAIQLGFVPNDTIIKK